MLWASLALVLGRVIDAVSDPLIGLLSDKSKFKWGRRKTFMLLGLPLMALSFFWLWHPPALSGDIRLSTNFLHALIFINLFFISFALYGIPYDAYLAEISQDNASKLRAANVKALFAILALVLGTLVLGLKDIQKASGLILLMALVPLLLSFWGMPEKMETQAEGVKPKGIALGKMPKSFWLLMGSVFFMEAASNFFFKSIDYFDQHILQQVPSRFLSTDLRHSLLYGAFALAMVCGLFFWEQLARKKNNDRLIAWVLRLGIILFPWSLAVSKLPGEWRTWLALVYFAGVGFIYAGLAIMIVAKVAASSQEAGNEGGIYFGIYAFVKKTGFALAVSVFALYVFVMHALNLSNFAYEWLGMIMAGFLVLAHVIFSRLIRPLRSI